MTCRLRHDAGGGLPGSRRLQEINDAQGHGTGDRVLVELAQRLLGGLRAGDARTARR
ncbi:MAG: diguanylate cyclase [Xanthomonadales bacterium]|nr:diguanylate cyclase [Xanthomonadales bacterium]